MKSRTRDIPDEEVLAELKRVAMAPRNLGTGRACEDDGAANAGKAQRASRPALTESEQRLWAEDRDENERVSDADWHPGPGTDWVVLESCQTVGQRRRCG